MSIQALYRSPGFVKAVIQRMLQDLIVVLDVIVRDPTRRVSAFADVVSRYQQVGHDTGEMGDFVVQGSDFLA
jgi:hypothetical protein